jgi:transcriptional regulator with XRE-family HTH domain
MVDDASTMKEEAPDLTARIAARVGELRGASGLSLEALAGKSGVSRSMISLIERGETSPTAVVLEKLAAGLGVSLHALFEAPAAADAAQGGPLARRADQSEWRDPDSGYLRRSVSPPGAPQPLSIVEIEFPAGARVAFENAARGLRIHQQVWLLEGTLDVRVGRQRHRLRSGDCLAFQVDQPTVYHNPTRKRARYAVVIATEAARR